MPRGDDGNDAHRTPQLVGRLRPLFAPMVRVRDLLHGLPGGVVDLHHFSPRPLHARTVAAWIQKLGEKLVILAAQPVGALGPDSCMRHLPSLPHDAQRAGITFDRNGEFDDGESIKQTPRIYNSHRQPQCAWQSSVNRARSKPYIDTHTPHCTSRRYCTYYIKGVLFQQRRASVYGP